MASVDFEEFGRKPELFTGRELTAAEPKEMSTRDNSPSRMSLLPALLASIVCVWPVPRAHPADA